MLINWPIVDPLFWANNSSKLVKAKINFPNNYIRVGWLSLWLVRMWTWTGPQYRLPISKLIATGCRFSVGQKRINKPPKQRTRNPKTRTAFCFRNSAITFMSLRVQPGRLSCSLDICACPENAKRTAGDTGDTGGRQESGCNLRQPTRHLPELPQAFKKHYGLNFSQYLE